MAVESEGHGLCLHRVDRPVATKTGAGRRQRGSLDGHGTSNTDMQAQRTLSSLSFFFMCV